MKLSDAILLGSTMHRQAFGCYCDGYTIGEVTTCALGAAMAATRTQLAFADMATAEWLKKQFPILLVEAMNPTGVNEYGMVGHIIPFLNDRCRWSRERIAEWVATEERRLEAIGVCVDAMPDAVVESSAVTDKVEALQAVKAEENTYEAKRCNLTGQHNAQAGYWKLLCAAR